VGVKKWIATWMLALSLPVVAAAQQDQTLRDRDPYLLDAKRLAEELQQANFRWGRFYLLSRFRLSEITFAGPVYVPAGDEDTGLSFGVEAPQRLYYTPHRKVILSAEATPSYAFFNARDASGEPRDGQFNYRLRGDAHFIFNHLYLDLYTEGSDDLRAHVADLNRLATTRERESGIAGELKYSSRTSALFTARVRDTRYPEDRYQPSRPSPGGDIPVPVQDLEREETNARVSLVHRTFPLTSFLVAAEGSEYDFRTGELGGASRRSLGGGVLFDSGRTELRLEAGATTLDFDDPSSQDFDGLTGSLTAIRTHRRWTAQGSWNRDVGFSLTPDNPFFRSDVRGASFDYQARRRVIVRLATAWQTDRYDQPVNGILRQDDVTFSTIGFRHTTRKLVTGLDVGWYERNSTTDFEEDSGIRYVVHLSFTP
jgi:hypothetical protein